MQSAVRPRRLSIRPSEHDVPTGAADRGRGWAGISSPSTNSENGDVIHPPDRVVDLVPAVFEVRPAPTPTSQSPAQCGHVHLVPIALF